MLNAGMASLHSQILEIEASIAIRNDPVVETVLRLDEFGRGSRSRHPQTSRSARKISDVRERQQPTQLNRAADKAGRPRRPEWAGKKGAWAMTEPTTACLPVN